MEKHLKPSEASRLDKCLALARKAVIASKMSQIDVTAMFTFGNFELWFKQGKDAVCESINMESEHDFDEKFIVLNHRMNYLIKHGFLPL